jgi:hypothetical protein
MHRSRVCAVLIDTPEAEADQAVSFWSAALGVSPRTDPSYPQFIDLPDGIPGIVTAVQSVDDSPRMHLDIETDDVEAETARLLALGATEVTQWQECRILRAPGGHLLCVLPVESDPDLFKAQANTWP